MSALSSTLSAFRKALERLSESLEEPYTSLVRDAAIKRFEFTFELAWKSIQRHLKTQAIECKSPKDAFRRAFALEIIKDSPLWLRMLDDRNLTTHTYDEETAARIYRNLADYVPLFQELSTGLSRSAEE